MSDSDPYALDGHALIHGRRTAVDGGGLLYEAGEGWCHRDR